MLGRWGNMCLRLSSCKSIDQSGTVDQTARPTESLMLSAKQIRKKKA